MKARNFGKIMVITGVLATFVLYLCAAVSKITPILFVAALIVMLAVCAAPLFKSFAQIIRLTQKTE